MTITAKQMARVEAARELAQIKARANELASMPCWSSQADYTMLAQIEDFADALFHRVMGPRGGA